jgi:hypothetical protein
MSHALLAAAKALAARLPTPGSPAYDTYHSRLELDALRRAIADHEPCYTRHELLSALDNAGAEPRVKQLLAHALDTLR